MQLLATHLLDLFFPPLRDCSASVSPSRYVRASCLSSLAGIQNYLNLRHYIVIIHDVMMNAISQTITAVTASSWTGFPEETQGRLAELRRLLGEKFPAADSKPGGVLPTGLAAVDDVEGGLRRAAVTELHGSTGSGVLFLQATLQACVREKCFAALVDAGRSFEPANSSSAALSRLLVVFCEDAMRAVKATDLLLRDGNLSLVLLDLQMVAPVELRKIPVGTWHRFQRLVEQTTTALVILTPQPMVEGAQVRIAADGNWSLAVQRRWRSELTREMPMRVFPRRTVLRVAA